LQHGTNFIKGTMTLTEFLKGYSGGIIATAPLVSSTASQAPKISEGRLKF